MTLAVLAGGRPCGQCGALFKPRRPKSKYCSRKCLGQHNATLTSPRTVEPFDKFAGYAEVGDDHWMWRGPVASDGYGRIRIPRRRSPVPAHRWSYELLVGPIPPDKPLDHLCRVTLCVRPSHLEPVTTRENVIRGQHPNVVLHREGHCKRGHPFSPQNTYYRRDGTVGWCRICGLLNWRKRHPGRPIRKVIAS